MRSTLEGVTLPDDTDEPRILKFDPGAIPAIVFGITDRSQDVRLRKELVRRLIAEPIERIEGVGSVILGNAPDPVVRVDVRRDRLLAVGLTLTEAQPDPRRRQRGCAGRHPRRGRHRVRGAHAR